MKKYLYAFVLMIFLTNSSLLSAQDSTYYFNGNPEKWTFSLNPFLFMPSMSGQLESKYLEQSFDASAVDLLSVLKMAFMMDAEISKGRFFISPTYIYMKIGAEKVIRTSHDGEETAVAKPEMKMNIAELMAGMRFPLGSKWNLDPYAGFRYNGFNTLITIDGILDTVSVEEKSTYWDPVLGFRVQYIPVPRWSVMFKADIGGFGVGSRISTVAGLNCGYAISPMVDLFGGFSVYAADFVHEANTGNDVSMAAAFYGFNIGARIIFPKRFRDPSIFKKDKS